MKAGKVISLRVNPKDCMSCIDVLEAAGLPIKNMSFAQVVSLALSSAMETFRTQQVIPTRDGFEFSEMMAPFGGTWSGRHKQKLEVTKLVEGVGSELQVKMPTKEEPEPEAAPMTAKQMRGKKSRSSDPNAFLQELDPITHKELVNEFKGLEAKRESKHIPGITWSHADEDRYQEIYKILFEFN